jgi:hypothetical protein
MSSDSLSSLIDENLPYRVFRLVFVIVLLLVTPILKRKELLITEILVVTVKCGISSHLGNKIRVGASLSPYRTVPIN